MKITKIKITKKDYVDVLSFNEGYLTDGNWMFKGEYVETDNELINQYIKDGKPFRYNKRYGMTTDVELPKCSQLIPKYNGDTTNELIYTGLDMTDTDISVMVNKNGKCFSYISNKYKAFLDKQNIFTPVLIQKSPLDAVQILNKDEIIGLIMPRRFRDTTPIEAVQKLITEWNKELMEV